MTPQDPIAKIVAQLADQAISNGTDIRLDLLQEVQSSATRWVMEYTKALKSHIQFDQVTGDNATAIVLQDFASGATRTFSELILSSAVGLGQAQFSLWRTIADVTCDASYIQVVQEKENTQEVAIKRHCFNIADRAKISPQDKDLQEETKRLIKLFPKREGLGWWAIFTGEDGKPRAKMTRQREREKYVRRHERSTLNNKPTLADYDEATKSIDQMRNVANQVIHAGNYWSLTKLYPEKVETEPMLIHASACLTRTLAAFRLATVKQIPYRNAKISHQAMEQYLCPEENQLTQAWTKYWEAYVAYQKHINRASS